MSTLPDDPRLDLARTVAAEAAVLASAYFANLAMLAIEEKRGGQDVVSEADREVEALIYRRIMETFPDDGFLGEETGLTPGTSGNVWVVDPIDGTSCFLHGLPDWCISIALVQGDEIRFGIIHQPTSGEVFVAAKGHGAFLNDAPIRVDASATLQTGLLALGANGRIPPRMVADFARRLLEAGGMFYRNGSGALMLAYVACGRLAAYYEPHINSWDCMAGLCLIREAGGWTNDFAADGDLLADDRIIAATPGAREELLALVAATEAAAS
ncbi:inositol monophosphatase [Starkeya sp. ORNL1]|uniref:inositol monophosphatase family protein n=1 Tax=Starkeya sp. ORNL1 TaxID=2709380 RepID=UPI0014628188|nr:inositol monophosphatase [Starkeya sp. ORNL1]QJP14179.1 inositol monophosphatase [Starkeya sp. ORNL1]